MSEELKRTYNPCDECPYGIEKRDGSGNDSTCKICEFADLVKANRRAQRPNEPLTVDELRKMIGQWVWVESKDVLCPNGWYRVEPQFRETISLAGVDGTIYETSITNGDSVSYRCPPKAGEKG